METTKVHAQIRENIEKKSARFPLKGDIRCPIDSDQAGFPWGTKPELTFYCYTLPAAELNWTAASQSPFFKLTLAHIC